EAEREAQPARDQAEATVELLEAARRVHEGHRHSGRDDEHAGDGPDAEDNEVAEGPGLISDRAEDEQRHGGRAGEAVHDADDERANEAVGTELPQPAIDPAEGRALSMTRPL